MRVNTVSVHDDQTVHREQGQRVGSSDRGVRPDAVHRRQVSHDIRHELSTIMLLASVVQRATDVGPDSRARVAQIIAEARWLEELITAYERRPRADSSPPAPSTPLDVVAAEILQPIRMSSRARIRLEATHVGVPVDRLALWRVLRNIVGNALAAAGEHGRVLVRIQQTEGCAVVDVDDDGPGFDPTTTGGTSLGLTIIGDLVQRWGGWMSIGRGSLGGCGVRLSIPAVER
jgi:two-component system OmpR family sensor kinase